MQATAVKSKKDIGYFRITFANKAWVKSVAKALHVRQSRIVDTVLDEVRMAYPKKTVAKKSAKKAPAKKAGKRAVGRPKGAVKAKSRKAA